jgi:BirA family transcriptional regulator, biotin operon repressor / biotin---[acetyl-CoA-carboxylase] ligase
MQAFYYDTVDSTNDLARSMVRDGRIRDAAYIVAREQTSGRGNRGRTWVSPLDGGIYLTVIDRPRVTAMHDLQAFTRAAGIACAETVRAAALIEVQLKPINDLYVRGRKLGGILTEAVIENNQLRALITGIGVNVRIADRDVPSDHVRPICLEELMPAQEFAALDVRSLTCRIVERICHWNAIVAAGEMSALESQWRRFVISEGQYAPTNARAMANE